MHLGEDLQKKIYQYLDPKSLAQMAQVNRASREVIASLPIYYQFSVLATNQTRFYLLCVGGYLALAQWFLTKTDGLNIHHNNDIIFRWVCGNGHLDVAQWLYETCPEINLYAENNHAFYWSCLMGHLKISQWLLSISEDKLALLTVASKMFPWARQKNNQALLEWLTSLASRE